MLIALLLGGRISTLSELRVRAPYLLIGAVGLRLLLAFPALAPIWCTPTLNVPNGGLVYIASFFRLLMTAILNLNLPGMKLVGIGLLSNLLVIGLNYGQMP